MSLKDRIQLLKSEINLELQYHPKAQLTDLFKLLSQSAFGPGHNIQNIDVAYKYYLEELNNSEVFDQISIQPCLYFNDFYRINLSLVKYGLIPVDELFRWFIESSNVICITSESEFYNEWDLVLEVIKQEKMIFNEFEKEMEYLNEIMKKNRFLCHHSEIYKNSYHPHYRIVHERLIPLTIKGY